MKTATNSKFRKLRSTLASRSSAETPACKAHLARLCITPQHWHTLTHILAMPPKASSSTQNAPAKLSAQEVPAMFQRYRTELQNLAQKIGELESELEEHTSVPWRYNAMQD